MKKVKVLALVTAVIASILVYNFLNSLSEKTSVEIVKAGVLTAAVNISPNTPITEEMLEVIELPLEAIHSEATANEAAAIGKFSKYEITAGEQILSSKLISPEGGMGDGTLAYSIKKGMRAITIGVGNLTGLSGMIKTSNKVDIIAQLDRIEKDEKGQDKTVSYTTMIAENISVLSVDDALSLEGKEINPETGLSYSSVTLQVTSAQAMELSMAEYTGQLRLIMRSPLDDAILSPPTIKIDDVIFN
jgi:pilus assembly protein CpaB